MSLGVSNSSSQQQATKQSTGPVAFGSVSIQQASKTPAWLWAAIAAAAAALAFLLFKRKMPL